MPQKEKAHQNGGPIPNAVPGQGSAETNSGLIELQARPLRQRFAVGYYFVALLAPLIWGVGPR